MANIKIYKHPFFTFIHLNFRSDTTSTTSGNDCNTHTQTHRETDKAMAIGEIADFPKNKTQTSIVHHATVMEYRKTASHKSADYIS